MRGMPTKPVVAVACIFFYALPAYGQGELVSTHAGGGPAVLLRNVHIGAVYSEINGFTARLEAALRPDENVAWKPLSMRLELHLDDGVRREVTMRCLDCSDHMYTYFESSPWEAAHVQSFVIRSVSGDYIAVREMPAYRGWVARDADCYLAEEAGSPADGCLEKTQGDLAATIEPNARGVPSGAAMVALTSGPGEPPESYLAGCGKSKELGVASSSRLMLWSALGETEVLLSRSWGL
jgi:hypothetical protein